MKAPRLLLGATFCALFTTQSQATILRSVSFDDKVDHAAAVILGKCVNNVSRRDPSGKWIVTYSTFRVEKTIAGRPAQEVTLVMPGGEVNGVHQETIGVPRFEVGDEHVVFVKDTSLGPTVLYFEQGAYDVDTIRGERVVKPQVSAAVLVDTQRGMAVTPEEPLALREFEERVRDRIARREQTERMEVLERKKRADSSLLKVLEHNKTLVLLALIGAVLATIHLLKRW